MEKDRELVLRMADAERETVSAMNSIMQKNNLPCFLYELIVDKIHRQLTDGKNSELVEAKTRCSNLEGQRKQMKHSNSTREEQAHAGNEQS